MFSIPWWILLVLYAESGWILNNPSFSKFYEQFLKNATNLVWHDLHSSCPHDCHARWLLPILRKWLCTHVQSAKTECVLTSAFSLFVLHLRACFKNVLKQIELQCLSKSILMASLRTWFCDFTTKCVLIFCWAHWIQKHNSNNWINSEN